MKGEFPELQLFSITRAAELLHLGKESLQKLINSGKIRVIKIGNSFKISYLELLRFIRENSVALSNSEIEDLSEESTIQNHYNYDSIEIFNQLLGEM